mmetsp:Transcript_102665/g.162255  ORF Transcript_102665/g.162255 Transcript_102665/m.162255 type:complete len:222 (-) Transcript_102665:77-742(-)
MLMNGAVHVLLWLSCFLHPDGIVANEVGNSIVELAFVRREPGLEKVVQRLHRRGAATDTNGTAAPAIEGSMIRSSMKTVSSHNGLGVIVAPDGSVITGGDLVDTEQVGENPAHHRVAVSSQTFELSGSEAEGAPRLKSVSDSLVVAASQDGSKGMPSDGATTTPAENSTTTTVDCTKVNCEKVKPIDSNIIFTILAAVFSVMLICTCIAGSYVLRVRRPDC